MPERPCARRRVSDTRRQARCAAGLAGASRRPPSRPKVMPVSPSRTTRARSRDAASNRAPWWRSAVIYQVYIRSFADADGDGIGDIAGIRSRLPYLAELGVDALWINPWYPSPMKDARLRRLRLPRHRSGVRDPRRCARHGRRRSRPRPAGPARHRPEPPVRPASLVPGCARRRPGIARAQPIRVPRRPGPGRRRAAERLAAAASAARHGRARIEADGEPGQWYLHLFTPEQPDLNWTQSGRPGRVRGDDALLVRSRRRRLPHRRCPRARQGRWPA